MKKLLLLAIVVLGISAVSHAQVAPNATANASATLVAPLKIQNTQELDYGTVAGSQNISTIVMATDGTLTPSAGAYVISAAGTSKAPKFVISGDPSRSFAISIPDEVSLSGNTSGVKIGSFVNSDTQHKIGSEGTLEISLGSTLTLPANVVAGTYKNTTDLKVTVNYN